MLSDEEHREWERLCDECNALKNAWLEMEAKTPKNPTSEQERMLIAAESRWVDCRRRMDEFESMKKQLAGIPSRDG